MESYLNCKKIDTAINRAKKILINKAKTNGIYENFGQKELIAIKHVFIDICDYSIVMNYNRMKVRAFENWCMEYTI